MYSEPKNVKHNPTQALKRVFVVEDHPVFREGLLQLVRAEKDLKVCGSAKTAAQALKEIARLEPDLVLVDISLPGKSGLQLIKQLRARNRKVKLLVVSMHDEALYANRVMQAGGDGYIMKEEEPSEIIEAIHDVLNGHIYVSERVLTGQAKGPRQSRSPQKSHPLNALTDLEFGNPRITWPGEEQRGNCAANAAVPWRRDGAVRGDAAETQAQDGQCADPLRGPLGGNRGRVR